MTTEQWLKENPEPELPLFAEMTDAQWADWLNWQARFYTYLASRYQDRLDGLKRRGKLSVECPPELKYRWSTWAECFDQHRAKYLAQANSLLADAERALSRA